MKPEDNPQAFLVLIVQTISVVLIWMIANVLVGIYFGYAFFADNPDWKNIVYYVFMIATVALLLKYLIKKWK